MPTDIDKVWIIRQTKWTLTQIQEDKDYQFAEKLLWRSKLNVDSRKRISYLKREESWKKVTAGMYITLFSTDLLERSWKSTSKTTVVEGGARDGVRVDYFTVAVLKNEDKHPVMERKDMKKRNSTQMWWLHVSTFQHLHYEALPSNWGVEILLATASTILSL